MMAAKKQSDMVPTSADLPAYLQDDEMMTAGKIQDDQDLLSPPRLKILHGTSSEISGHQLGDIWSQAHNEVLSQGFEFIPIKFAKEWMRFNDDLELEWRTADPNDVRVTSDDDAWKYKTIHCLILGPVGGQELPVIASFRGTDFKSGRTFYQETLMKKVPAAGQVYTMSSKKVEGGKHTWYNSAIRFSRFATEEEFSRAKDIFRAFANIPLTPTFEDAAKTEQKDDVNSALTDEVPF
jgi:hypothetical protein